MDQVAAQLVYTTDDPAGTCASETELRGKVASRLGYDPFIASAPWVFRVRIDARRRPRAEIVTEQRGEATRRRELDDATCEALTETLASTVAIAIDPLATTAAAPASPAAPSPAAPTEPVTPSTSRAVAPPSSPSPPGDSAARPAAAGQSEHASVVPSMHLDGVLSLGRTAGIALGARGGFALRYRALSLAGEARGEATAGAVRLTPRDSVYFSVFSAALVPCGHLDIFELCGVVTVGTLQARAKDVTRPTLKGSLFGSIGARFGVRLPITRAIALRANAETGFPLVRTTFIVEGEPVWTAPVVQATFAIGAEARFR